MKPYTLEQVLALPDGAGEWLPDDGAVWFELPGGALTDFRSRDCIRRLTRDLSGTYGTHWRVWPTHPTDAEREAEAWGR